MPKKYKIPKNFLTYATSPTKEGIEKSIKAFYGGESKNMIEQQADPNEQPSPVKTFKLQSQTTGRILDSVMVIETERGFYFGHFN